MLFFFFVEAPRPARQTPVCVRVRDAGLVSGVTCFSSGAAVAGRPWIHILGA
jgi:hypothetical protein